ncbi:DNA replication/repair protein RecF [candidate division KSB1 bacterium]
MFLRKFTLQNFRNYGDVILEFNRCGNLLFGRNGQGKTNLLESIYYLSVFRSFRRGTDKEIVRWDNDWFRISGFFDTGRSADRSITVRWEHGGPKQVYFENDRMQTLSEMIGIFPAVLMSPESVEITQGQPVERRRFLDLCFSMVDREYLENLIAYRRVLRQRNRLLSSFGGNRGHGDETLEAWTEKLIEHGSFIIDRRAAAIDIFSDICREMYAEVSTGSEALEMRYHANLVDVSDSAESFRAELGKLYDEELNRGATLIGPHRDDLLLFLDGHDARKYGSQGQHKTILLALKAAELQFISEKRGIQPVILLDDLFALLDSKRIMAFLKVLKRYGQFFITSNVEIRPDFILTEAGFSASDFSQFYVEGGSVQHQS